MFGKFGIYYKLYQYLFFLHFRKEGKIQEIFIHEHVKSVTVSLVAKLLVDFINSFPGVKLERDLWDWTTTRDIWLAAAYISGRLNEEADA